MKYTEEESRLFIREKALSKAIEISKENNSPPHMIINVANMFEEYLVHGVQKVKENDTKENT